MADFLKLFQPPPLKPVAIDGDTFTYGSEHIRIQNVYAPESSEPGGPEARAKLQAALDAGQLQITRSGKDVHGRTLAWIEIDKRILTQADISERAGIGSTYAGPERAPVVTAAPAQKSTEPPGPIRLPEWNEVLRLQPREQLTPQDRRAWNAYLAQESRKALPVATLRERITPEQLANLQAAGLTSAKLEQLLRGRQLHEDMQRSEIPEWRQKLVRLLTQLDNIEDQVSTVLWVTDPLTRRWAPTRAISEVAHRTTDAVSNIQQAIAGPALYKALAKSKAARKNKRSSRSVTGKLGNLQRAAGWLKTNQGRLLEAGQALETWTGVGISLGPIFGAMEEAQDRLFQSAYEGAKFAVAAAGRAVTRSGSDLDEILANQQAASVQRIRETGLPVVEQFAGWIRKALDGPTPFSAISAILGAAGHLQRDNDLNTPAAHALALYHSATLSPILGEILRELSQTDQADRIPELDAAQPIVGNTYSRDILREAGATLDQAGHPTGAWQEPHRTVAQLTDKILLESEQARATWLPWNPITDEDFLLHSLVEANAPATSYLLAGNPYSLHITPDPETRAELLALHLDELPPADTTPEQLRAWLADQVAAINQHADSYDWRTWREVTNRHWKTAI